MGVEWVSKGIEFDTQFRIILKKLRQMYTNVARLRQNVDTFDTLSTPLRGGGCRSYSSIVPMLIAQFWCFSTLQIFFYFFSAKFFFRPFRCRSFNCGRFVVNVSYA